jgi:hypothetical protein
VSLDRLNRYLEAFYKSHPQALEPRLAATGSG